MLFQSASKSFNLIIKEEGLITYFTLAEVVILESITLMLYPSPKIAPLNFIYILQNHPNIS
jgi:hypothetical protein